MHGDGFLPTQNKSTCSQSFLSDETVITDKTKIASNFYSYFCNIAKHLQNKEPHHLHKLHMESTKQIYIKNETEI